MKGCRPLSNDEIKRILKAFTGKDAARDKAMFRLGITTGFRISEMLSLRIKDVVHKKKIRRVIEVRRRYTKGRQEGRQAKINKPAQQALLEAIKAMQDYGSWSYDTFLFRSRKGKNSHITRQHAYHILITAFEKAGVHGKLGTHSMRKTFGNNIYDYMIDQSAQGKHVDPFRETAKALGHKDLSNTEKYLSFRNEYIDAAIDTLTYDED